MSNGVWRLLLGGFFIAHGLIHSGYGATPPSEGSLKWPFDLSHSWLLSGVGLSQSLTRSFGTLLWVATTIVFVAAGLGVFGILIPQDWWRTLAVVAAVASFLLLVLFWHPWLVIGVLLDIGILVVLIWAHWPPAAIIGSSPLTDF